MYSRQILFEKFEDVIVLEHEMARVYQACLNLAEDLTTIESLKIIIEDEIKHVSMARRLLELAQNKD